MNINRDNYEEYFLLYADNELSAAEKNIVELFLTDNPDLKEEMRMLQQAILEPEQVFFENKENLLKPQPLDTEIQQQLLLLLDNELAVNEKQHIESLIKNDESVKKEWSLLQQTKLSAADTIVFDDKESLYKKESGRVVPFRWWRIAAAAILIGFGLWGAVSYFNKNTTALPAAETASGTNNVKPAEKTAGVTDQNIPANSTIEKEAAATAIKQNGNSNNTLPENKILPQSMPSKEKNEMVLQQQENNNLPKPVLENLNNTAGNKTETANVSPEKKEIKNETGSIGPVENKITAPDTYAVNTVFADNSDSKKNFARFDEEEEDDKPKKTKIGGFFKKVKRVLERKANIKTGSGDNIKIANMSFAMQ